MSNIRQVQWVPGRPERLRQGMVMATMVFDEELIFLIGDFMDEAYRDHLMDRCLKWAWLIQPHELTWLEDMASRKTRTQE
ncbi:hypothetical protein [Pseudomonas multiresinivorans]|uniref:Uncharacterized protein n=1 Tax=Pseudomonas multiresinivorans TaxID=95301 RepID=A0A7Z3BP76_9PSED|nr:hypothetical protein [Pseudomonas multiresinivorans]QJP10472.1 hypothetical protein G4G71_22240 [Pseudomonas multiresinivorans]